MQALVCNVETIHTYMYAPTAAVRVISILVCSDMPYLLVGNASFRKKCHAIDTNSAVCTNGYSFRDFYCNVFCLSFCKVNCLITITFNCQLRNSIKKLPSHKQCGKRLSQNANFRKDYFKYSDLIANILY